MSTDKPRRRDADHLARSWADRARERLRARRSPPLFISGKREKDPTVLWTVTNAAVKRQRRNKGVTEIVEVRPRARAHHRQRLK